MKEDQTKHQNIHHPISFYRLARFLCLRHIVGLSYTGQNISTCLCSPYLSLENGFQKIQTTKPQKSQLSGEVNPDMRLWTTLTQ
jgi:hypothetical protein